MTTGVAAQLKPLLQATVLSQSTWRRRLSLLILGGVMALSMAPTFLFWLIPLCLPLAWWSWHQAPSWRDSAGRLWWFSAGFFLVGLYWITIAVTADLANFWWFAPVPLILFPGFLAFLQAALTLPFGWFRSRGAWPSILAFAAAWIFVEWVKLWAFTGFPWNYLGYSLAFSPWTMQAASLGGIWLLSAVVVLGSVPLGLLLTNTSRRHKLMILLFPLIAYGGLFGYSFAVLLQAPSIKELVEGQPVVALIQPNLPQGVLQSQAQRDRVVQQQIDLSKAAVEEAQAKGLELRAVIWSEAAISEFLHLSPDLLKATTEYLPAGSFLIAGAVRAALGHDGEPLYYNSVEIVDHHGQLVNFYNKRHLVPFGEYVPLRRWIPMQASITGGLIDTTPGENRGALAVKGLGLISPSICYEGIIPNFFSHPSHDTSDWILNVTNDGWYGTSTGPFQHFAQHRMRAVEERKPLVRVSNPGISAVVDGFGRIIGNIPHNEKAYSIVELPKRYDAKSLFKKIGNYLSLFVCLILVTIALIASQRRILSIAKQTNS